MQWEAPLSPQETGQWFLWGEDLEVGIRGWGWGGYPSIPVVILYVLTSK